MQRKKNIIVLTGGPSLEHDISLASGREIVRNLDSKKYNIFPVVISKNNISWIPIKPNDFLSSGSDASLLVVPHGKSNSISILKQIQVDHKIDACFIALHGAFGEDGTIQAILDFLKIPYTGSGMLASGLGMDKLRSKQIFQQNGLLVPDTIIIKRGEKYSLNKISYPVVVKPNNQGSSIGVFIAHNKNELAKEIKSDLKIADIILLETYIKGLEVTCAVLGNDKPKALPVIEIVPKAEFFDYKAKYTESQCDEIVPARISKKLTLAVQKVAITAFKALGCRGFGRVDMIIQDDKIFILELNTIPGLTAVSLLPKAAAAAGISFSKLLDKMIEFSLKV
jgi:D-alanine-D-alanine ligase